MRIERENLRKEQGNTSFTPRPQSKHVRCEAAFVRFNLRCPRLRKEVFPWNTVGWEKCGPVWHGCSCRWWGQGRGRGPYALPRDHCSLGLKSSCWVSPWSHLQNI